MNISIGSRIIGENEKPYFIADIAANHDGDINRAFMLIELAKEAGADCAKFQNFKAKTIVSKNGFGSMNGKLSHQKSWNKSVYDVYSDASLPDDWSSRLKEKCDEFEIEYMTSPYDFDSVDIADKYSNAFKIGSGDITWLDMVRYVSGKGKPVLIATGASEMTDVERAVNAIYETNDQLILMQCNTNYTASPENYKYINLNVLKTYREKFPRAVLGLSDHTFGCATVLGAVALGARVIEKHFTDDNDRMGPDHKFSMNPKTWREMVNETERLYLALGDGNKRIEKNETETSIVQRRVFYYQNDFEAGHVISAKDIFPLRPVKDGAVLPYQADKIIGRKLITSVKRDDDVKWTNFE